MLLYALRALALAQASAAAPAAAPMISVSAVPLSEAVGVPAALTKGTRVALLIKATLSSSSSHPGDRFPIKLADPVVIDGKIVLAPGAAGEGEVVHAAKARWGGKAGELIVNARFLDCRGVRVPLGKLKFAQAGENNTVGAMAAGAVFLPAMFIISGGSVTVPSGTRVSASIIGDVILPPLSDGHCDGGITTQVLEGKQ